MKQQKKKFKSGFKKWCDDKSLQLRKQLKLNDFSPLCAIELSKHLGIPIWKPHDVQGLSEEILTELLFDSKQHWSAVTIPIDENKNLIIHNTSHSPARQQSNLMHEIAHVICAHKVPKVKYDLGLSGFLRNYDQTQEDEAEWLGSCLQLPRTALLHSLKRSMSIEEISIKYNASQKMVNFRINVTGVKKQLSYMKS